MGTRTQAATGRTAALAALVLCAGAVLAAWWMPRREPVSAAAEERPMPPVIPVISPAPPAVAEAPPAPPAPPPVPPAPAPATNPSKLELAKAWGVTVKVKKGETLIDLAADHLGSPDLWRDLLEVNADKVTKPERLLAGMLIRLPEGVRVATAEEIRVSRFLRSIKGLRFEWYTVIVGDTLASIAQKRYGDAAKSAWIANANADAFAIPPDAGQALPEGQRLRLPKGYVPGDGCGG